MRHPLFSALLCSLVLAVSSAQANEVPTPISRTQFTAAAAGEVLIEAQRGTPNRGQVIGFVAAPLADVVAIVIDTNTHSTWFPDTVESRTIERNGSTGISSGVTHVPLLRDRTWTITGNHSRPRYNGVQCDLVEYDYVADSGNMNDLFGYWLMCPEGEGTVVKYVINADLGVWLPGAVVTWAQRRMLPGIISGLQARWTSLHS